MTTSNAGTFPYTDADGTVWLAFSDWGEGKRDRILMSVHGLTRQSRDFDFLSSHLKDQFRVIEVDLAGHGKSGWLANKSGYCIENFLRHIDALLDYRGISQMDWLGTGTGGLMGIILAARQVTPIRRLILNDIGPSISASSIESFRTRFLEQPVFSHLSEAEKYFRKAISLGLNMKHDMAMAKLSLAGIAMQKRRKREATSLLKEAKKLDKQGIMGEQIKLMQQQLKRI